MKNTTLFRYNRIIILAGLLLCSAIPFIQIEIPQQSTFHNGMRVLEDFLISKEEGSTFEAAAATVAENMTHEATITDTAVHNTFSWKHIIIAAYIAGFLLTALHFVFSAIQMVKLIKRCEKISYPDYILAICDQPIASFNWGKYIVLSRQDYENNPEEVFLHEYMHLSNYHTLDLLISQLLIIIHWFNPACWILKRELQEIHEYEADNGVINNGIDATEYQLLLVKKAVGTRLYSMANGFNHSKLKNRITMMLKEKTKKRVHLMRAILLLPLFMSVVFLFARPEVIAIADMVVVQRQEPQKAVKKNDLAEYEKQVYGRELSDAERNYGDVYLRVNMEDKLLFNDEFPQISELKDHMRKVVLEERKKTLITTGKEKAVIIDFTYDGGSSYECIQKIENIVSELSEELKASLITTEADAADPDKLFPVMLYLVHPRTYGKPKPLNENIAGVRITFMTAGNQKQVIENFTLESLETEMRKYNDISTVTLQADRDTKMAVIEDIKRVIKKVYGSHKINFRTLTSGNTY